MRLYGNIQKVDADKRMVYGYASTEAKDNAGEIVTKAAVEAALTDYLEFANIREMHQLSAVGTAEEATVDDKGLYIAAHVVDDAAWSKVQAGVYKGFSIGGKTQARDPLNKKIITKIALNEISLVDRPSNPEARFDVWKAAGIESEPDMKLEDENIAKALAEKAALDKIAADALAKVAADEAAEALAKAAPDGGTTLEPAAVEPAEPAPLDPLAKATAAVDALAAALAPAEDPLAKGMYGVADLADLLSSLSWIVRDSEFEAEMEGDKSKVPAKLRAALTALASAFKLMAAEEVSELLDQGKTKKAAEAEAIAKVATEAADALAKATATEALAKADTATSDLAKALTLRDEALSKIAETVEPLVKAVNDMRAENDALAKRLEIVEAAPAAPRTAGPGASVSKGDDAPGDAALAKAATISEEDMAKALAAMSEEDRAMLLIKASHSLPRQIRV